MAGGWLRDPSPAVDQPPVTWVAMLNRTVCLTGAVVVGTALAVTFTVVLGDGGARRQLGLWAMLIAHSLLVASLVGLAWRSLPTPVRAGVLLLSTIALVGACSLGWATVSVSPAAVRLLPIQALHAQLVLAAMLLQRRRTTVLVLAATVAGTVWLTSLGNSDATDIGFDDCVLPVGYALTAMVLIRGLRSAAWDANRLAARMREARVSVIASSHVQLADDEGRRVVHDRVLSALAAAEAGRDPDEVADACALALDDLAALDPTTSASALREALVAKERLHLIVGGEGWPMSPPPRVVTALRESAGEAIRNAEEHAGVDEVSVTLTSTRAGQAAVVVHDTGRGFDPEKVRGFGLSESIAARMGQVGGEARIESAPEMGTTVRLLWPIQSNLVASSGAGVLAADGRSRLYVGVTIPLGLAAVFAAVRQMGEAQAPWASVLLAVFVAVALAGWGYLVGRGRPSWPVVATLVLTNTVVTLVGLEFAPLGTVLSLAAWPVTACSLALGGLALAGRGGAVIAATIAEVATVAVFNLLEPGIGLLEPVGTLLLPVAYAAAGYAVGILLRRGSVLVAVQESLANAEMDEEGWLESAQAARHHYAGELQDHVAPFLIYLAQDKPKPSPAVRTRARGLAAQCRDLLALSQPMPASARTAVLAARNRGVRVAVRDAPSVSPVAWALLTATVQHAGDAVAVTLIPARRNHHARVTVIPRVSAQAESRIRRDLAGHTVWSEHTEVTSSFILVSPEWGPSIDGNRH